MIVDLLSREPGFVVTAQLLRTKVSRHFMSY